MMRRRRVVVAIGIACTVVVMAGALWWIGGRTPRPTRGATGPVAASGDNQSADVDGGGQTAATDTRQQDVEVLGWRTTRKLNSFIGLNTESISPDRSEDIILVVRVRISPQALGARALKPGEVSDANLHWSYNFVKADFKLGIEPDTRLVAGGLIDVTGGFSSGLRVWSPTEPNEWVNQTAFFIVNREQIGMSATTFQYKDFRPIQLNASNRDSTKEDSKDDAGASP